MKQFGGALHYLNIDLIWVNSPQAKGRVERANLTLQNLLVKEMRLENISGIVDANIWLETSISDINRRLGRHTLNICLGLCQKPAQSWMRISPGRRYALSLDPCRFSTIMCFIWLSLRKKNARIAGEKIMPFDDPDGTITFRYGSRTIRYQIFDMLACIDWGRIVNNNRLSAVL